LLTTEMQQTGTPTLELVHTIELPFIPHDIAVAPDGSLYAVELGAPKVHWLDGDGNVMASWGNAGGEAGQFAFEPPPEGPQLDGGFIVVGAGGDVYVSDSYNNRVQVFSPEGEFLAMWERYGPEDTVINNPGPISADARGHIYVADFGGAHQFNAEGNYVQTLQAAGEIAFDSQGNLYTVVLFENIAMKIPASGGEPLIWGEEGMENGQFTAPVWVVVGLDDTVYISDHSGRVQAFDAQGNFQALWSGPEGNLGPLTAPASLAIDADGNIYVAPKDRTTVYVLRP
jgi:DNA-binding beta-propeller fold protein YncE